MSAPFTTDELGDMRKADLLEAAERMVELLNASQPEPAEIATRYVVFERSGQVPGGHVRPGFVCANPDADVLARISHREITAEQYEAAPEGRQADKWISD